jgi:predicted nuclease with TOPRIM domain
MLCLVLSCVRHAPAAGVSDLYAVVVPVIVAFIIALSGAIAIRRYAGPAQQALLVAQQALAETQKGRMQLLIDERSELVAQVKALTIEITGLRTDVSSLERQLRELTKENLDLRRSLNNKAEA